MTELPKRELGRTGLEVTMLGYGAMELRGAPRARDISEAQAETILNAVLDSGINYIDTSIDYGLSEERIGRYIGHRRDEYYLASKCGCLVGAPPAPRGDRSPHVFTPENIIAGVEQSLRRMQTDHLDVVQFHSSPSQRTLQDNGAVDALLKLKDAGKVRFIGMSGTFPNLKDHIAMGIFDVFQNSLFGRRAGARGGDYGGVPSRSGHRHSRRRGEGRAGAGQAGRDAMGSLGTGRPRRSVAGDGPGRIRPALYLLAPGHGHDDRRYREPVASPRQSGCTT